MIRENWRVVLLCVLVVGSGIALFAPGVAGNNSGTAAAQPTNLQYGIQLDGGTRIRAPVTGLTATVDNVTADNQLDVQTTVANELGLEQSQVRARTTLDTVEVYAEVNETPFRNALAATNVSVTEIRDGVTAPTRETIVDVLQDKLDQTGLGGTTVQQIQSSQTGEHYILVEVPGQNVSDVRQLVTERGSVRQDAYFPRNGSMVNETVLTSSDLKSASIGTPYRSQTLGPVVPVTLTEPVAADFAAAMRQYGFTSNEGVSNCRYESNPNATQYCLLTVNDGEVVYSSSMGADLAQSMENGDFVTNPQFVIQADTLEDARQLQVDLRAGALPSTLDLDRGTTYYISPSLAERFKPLSFLTGFIAALAVGVVVYLRYGEARVAVPMVATALCEVVVLLGFASLTQLALDLSHIAGFIAVIGTGVDDLIIIADEVMTEEVSSSRVFQSRFRKALWIIGAAAATTIIAMSPLAFLSLGDLRGFAIVTILGVLVGVLVTRPAYGDILRRLLTDDR
ncbi:preprotein translocase subunit SecD [Salarchaeum japonicum]|uniref:Protein-export membrane protein SecD n=1 Tax=Salarchaeum japonicum TaxID=555573 RepID=A0AAV3SZX7_9EURY|nr:preprotein translocase subunit SecD [Salarchaeum japonicum]